uniref:Partitioning protein ParA n=1 Tax=Polaromonas sp. H8N TaxID=1840297 RepID=A0A2S1FIB8_9BURK|nr:ParA family protein [Polaromonas sp. H8N]AWD72264.1 partitioning protein ParA [Polaromonas sp. H8N]
MKTIGVIQVKGGAGRSTVATTLAGELSKQGKTVLIDCDMPQGTSASWFAVRQQSDVKQGQLFSQNLAADTAANHRELVAKVEQYKDVDYLVLDGPPRIAELTRAILVLADLCLVPVGASKAEIWATSDILSLIEEAKQVKPVKVRMLWTRYRPQTKLTQELTALVKQELGLAALDTSLGMRVSYMEALGDGLTAAELADPSAKAEVRSLIEEVKKLMRSI